MARQLTLSLAASLLVASTALAQQTERPRTVIRSGPMGAAGSAVAYRMDGSRLVLGLSTSSGGARDTLGLLVTSIAPGGPAEKAGLEEGNRLVAINGVPLRLNAADAADPEMAGVLGRRLQREMEKTKAGDAVTLSVHADGRTREVRITPVRADELSPAGTLRARADSRPTIGASIGGFGSPRDTLGVFVMAVTEDGPLARAGVHEGSRIASVNGIDLRVPVADVNDDFMTSARVRRLTREIEKLDAGGNVELRVYANGQYRNVTVKTVRRSELKQDASISIFHSGGSGAVFVPPMDLRFDDGRLRFEMEHLLDGDVRERIERALRDAESGFRGFREQWRDGRGADELPREPMIRERSGGSDETMPVEEVLKEIEQRLRENATSTGRSFRTAGAALGTSVMASPLNTTATGTYTFQPAVAGTQAGFGGVSPDAQGISGTPAQGRTTGGVATYRSSKPADQGGVFVVNGIRFSPISANLASYLGRGSERGLLILEVPSHWTGITAGDVILSVNGTAVRNGDTTSITIHDAKDQCVELLREGVAVKSTLRAR